MAPVRRVVLDVLKPHQPSTVEVASRLADLDGIEAVNALLVETDAEVQTLKLTVEGSDIAVERVDDEVERLGGSVHSVDQVVCGEYLVEEVRTPQD
ncbi:DUF211 domain-containing protein [Haloplanus halophilus]|uniref:DUF211 domain-containing protein n=1 Tax=Haloplanus halophilus TaxID=2949993 RepID=UPI00204244CB|nr:DUF211 domain-containing protein [Haloplanus sp. GDY1]